MIFTFKKKKEPEKKLVFVFKKKKAFPKNDDLFSDNKYKELVKKYGEPRRDSLDGEPSINGFGIAAFPDGSTFIQDCVSGRIIQRTTNTRYLGTSSGFHFYVGENSKYSDNIEAIPSFPAEIIPEGE